MTLLAIDSSTRAVGLALYDGHSVLYESAWHSQDFHTVELAPAIDQALKRAGLRITHLKAVGMAIGPGSYTGLRIGLALAKGLALARRLPLISVPTLDVIAAAQPPADAPLAAVLQAGRGRLAVGWYRFKDGQWIAAGEATLTTIEELSAKINKPTVLCGELYEEERRVLARKRVNARVAPPARSIRRPAILAELAWARWQAGETDEGPGLGPVYITTNEAIPG